MKKNNKTVEQKLQDVRFLDLSEREAGTTWQKIHARIESGEAFSPLSAKRKTMIPLLIGALLFASAGGTVAASNSATPGDVLFPVDRAVESVRIALARNEGKAELKLKFAEERLGEVQKLIAEARLRASATSTATTTASTTATTTPKRVNDNVALGVNVALSYLNDLSADLAASGNADAVAKLEGVIDRLENIANDDDVKVRLKSDNNFQLRLRSSEAGSASSSASTTGEIRLNTSGNKDRIEVREDGERIRIEVKANGDVKIKSQSNDDEDKDNDDDDQDEEDKKDEDRGNRGRGGVNLNSNLRLDLR